MYVYIYVCFTCIYIYVYVCVAEDALVAEGSHIYICMYVCITVCALPPYADRMTGDVIN